MNDHVNFNSYLLINIILDINNNNFMLKIH
jgi:hypothetical protein